MHQTKKGNQWYFGMKAHIGVDSQAKIIHAVVATAANVADSQVLADLLHGEETRVWGDQAYRGQREVIKSAAPNALDFTNRRYRHNGIVDEAERAKNRTKSKVRVQGRACVRRHQVPVRLRQGSLSRPGQERPSPVRHLRAGQSLHRAPPAHEQAGGVMPQNAPQNATTTPKRGKQIEPTYALRRQ